MIYAVPKFSDLNTLVGCIGMCTVYFNTHLDSFEDKV